MSETSQRDSIACTYCGDGKYTGLPGNACENCMNTGLAHPTDREMKDWIVETRVTSRRVYLVQAEDEKEAIFFSTQVSPEYDEDEYEETMSVVENPNTPLPPKITGGE